MIRKTLTTAVAALALSLSLGFATQPAQAHDGHNAALIGGLAIGALIGSAIASHSDDSEDYDNSSYARPTFYRHGYDNDCSFQQRPVTDRWGYVIGSRRVWTCD